MKITIESTTKIVNANGIDCRVWEGKTESGVEVTCLIPRIAVNSCRDTSQFDAELQEQRAPLLADAWPYRIIL